MGIGYKVPGIANRGLVSSLSSSLLLCFVPLSLSLGEIAARDEIMSSRQNRGYALLGLVAKACSQRGHPIDENASNLNCCYKHR